MSALVNRKTAKMLINWCRERYGESQYADFSTLIVKIDMSLKHCGQYVGANNTITLNPKFHRSTISWCSTVIHEYTHFLQDMDKYFEYRNSYYNHPYEKTANGRSERDKFEARRWLKRKLDQRK